MLRRGRHKYVCCGDDPEQLYDLEADPHELDDLAPTEPRLCAELRDELQRRWDMPALHGRVLRSQEERRIVVEALTRDGPRAGTSSHAPTATPSRARTTCTSSSATHGSTRPPVRGRAGDRLRRAQRLALRRHPDHALSPPTARPARSGSGRPACVSAIRAIRASRSGAAGLTRPASASTCSSICSAVASSASSPVRCERVEDVQALLVVAEDLRRRVQPLLRARLAEVGEVRLDGVVGAAAV